MPEIRVKKSPESKGMGTLLKILHLSYSFGQKCSKLGTFTVKGLKIQKREEIFLFCFQLPLLGPLKKDVLKYQTELAC
jgi:hypothetical protein